MDPELRGWIDAFALTEVIEAPIVVAALRSAAEPRGWGRALAIALGASALTHPVVWFAFPRLVPEPYWAMLATAEVFAVGAEALYLRGFKLPRALETSLIANAASFGVGLVSRALLGWP